MTDYLITFRDGTRWYIKWPESSAAMVEALDRFVACCGPVVSVVKCSKDWTPESELLLF